jgi:hypothetical protein
MSRRTVEALWPALHPIHEVDAVLGGDRATPTTNSCAGNRDKALREEMLTICGANWFGRRAGTCRLHAIYDQPWVYVGKVGETVKYGWARHPRRGRSVSRLECRLSSAHSICSPSRAKPPSAHMLQVDLLHHSILGRRARVQSDDHHVQANLPAAKTTTHTMRAGFGYG